MMKKALSLILAGLLVLCPLLAQADQTLNFTVTADIDPQYINEDYRTLAEGLAAGLETMSFQGDITFNEDWKFDMNANLLVKDKKHVDAHIQSNSQWVSITSNLLGDERIALMMQVYLEFAMKPYNFMGLNTQYLALLTSRYAHTSAWDPIIEMCAPVLGGEGDRTIPAEDLVALAEQIALYAEESREFRYWVTALLMDLGGDEMLNEMMYTLPDWIAEMAGEEGLTIATVDNTETWTMGGEELFAITRQADGHYDWKLNLYREGYVVSALCQWAEGGKFTANVEITLEEAEEDNLVFTLAAVGNGLPDGQAASQADLSIEMGGYLLGDPVSVSLTGAWDTADDGTINAQVSLLDAESGEPEISLAGAFTPVETKEGLLNFTNSDLENGATNVFTLHEITLADFVSRIKGPAVKVGAPLVLSLPASFSLNLLDWLTEAGFVDLVLGGEY
ncbi:MAG: hypothetical protein IJF65_02385 [Clostridia bacterium]|nr:hypothetical protein [Clostridia bacterium]